MSARGSGSAFGNSVLPRSVCCAVALSAVQPVNGLGPDATTGGAAEAVATTANAATHAAPRVSSFCITPPFVTKGGAYKTVRRRASRLLRRFETRGSQTCEPQNQR